MTERSRSNCVWPVASLAAGGCLWGTSFTFGKIYVCRDDGSRKCWLQIYLRLSGASTDFLEASSEGRWLPCSGAPSRCKCHWCAGSVSSAVQRICFPCVPDCRHLTILVALSSSLLLKEKLRPFEYGLMGASAGGAGLIAMAEKAGPQPTMKGDLLVFLSMFAAMVIVLLSKRLMGEYDAVQFTSCMIGIGTLILLAWVEATNPMRFHFSLHIWLAVMAQVFSALQPHFYCGTGDWPGYLLLTPQFFLISNRWLERY